MIVSKEAGSSSLRIGDVFTKALPVTLKSDELTARAQEMAGAQTELTRLEEEKKRVSKEFSEKIKPLKAKVEQLAPVVESGVEERQVDVQWEQELGAASAVLRRLDTGEALEETRRALSEQDLRNLQGSFGFSGAAAGEEPPVPVLEFNGRPALTLPGHTAESKPLTSGEVQRLLGGPVDYRKAPVNANRGMEFCPEESDHEYGKPDAEGWESCRKCPQDRRVVAKAPVSAVVTDMGEVDLSESEAALDALEAKTLEPSLRWPLGDTMWMLSIEKNQLWFHSPDTSSTSSRRHGPAGWVPEAHGTDRIVPWTSGGTELADVPLIIVAEAVTLLGKGAEGLVLPRPMAEVKAAIAAERERDMKNWDLESKENDLRPEDRPSVYRLGDDMPGWTLEVREAATAPTLLWLCGEGQRWPFTFNAAGGVLLPYPATSEGRTLAGFKEHHKPMIERAEDLCRNGVVLEVKGGGASSQVESVDAVDLTDAGSAFLRALLDGPKNLDQIRAKTTNRRPGITAKSLEEKGLAELCPGHGTDDSTVYQLTAKGLQVAERLQAEKDAKRSKKG